jgi:DNA-binding XRE family transcriptional regulator
MAKEKMENGNPEKETKSHPIPDIDRELIMKIAARAKEMRVNSGHSYESFAIRAEINRNTYFRFERSAKTGENFTMALLIKVIRGLNMTVSEFMKTIQ